MINVSFYVIEHVKKFLIKINKREVLIKEKSSLLLNAFIQKKIFFFSLLTISLNFFLY
jgi:hypothetical protein